MSQIREYLDEHKDEMIALLSDLVAVRSVQGDAEDGKPFGKEPARALETVTTLIFNSLATSACVIHCLGRTFLTPLRNNLIHFNIFLANSQ